MADLSRHWEPVADAPFLPTPADVTYVTDDLVIVAYSTPRRDPVARGDMWRRIYELHHRSLGCVGRHDPAGDQSEANLAALASYVDDREETDDGR